jgi:hypothetical protein
MKRLIALLIVPAAVTALVGAARAADPRYPDWPCAQAKVPEISVAAVWEGPPLQDAASKWKDDPKTSALVARVSARRTPLDEAEKDIKDLLAASPDKKQAGVLVFAGLFDTLNAQRAAIMNGLERVTRRQRDAADKIRSDTMALHTLQDASPPDQSRIEEMANQVMWETRIFEDRRRVTKFVCDVPTEIDQRLFALARIIQQNIE